MTNLLVLLFVSIGPHGAITTQVGQAEILFALGNNGVMQIEAPPKRVAPWTNVVFGWSNAAPHPEGLAWELKLPFFPEGLQFSKLPDSAQRNGVLSNVNYRVVYHYKKDSMFTRPLTNPMGQAHYEAKACVFEMTGNILKLVGKTVDCQYTEGGCFEDAPIKIIRDALGIPFDTTEYNEWANKGMPNVWP